jgi:hypothetical protein
MRGGRLHGWWVNFTASFHFIPQLARQMMLFLSPDVCCYAIDVGSTYRKGAVAALPLEYGFRCNDFIHEVRRYAFELLDQIGDTDRAWKLE